VPPIFLSFCCKQRELPDFDPWVTPRFLLGDAEISTGSPKVLLGSPKGLWSLLGRLQVNQLANKGLGLRTKVPTTKYQLPTTEFSNISSARRFESATQPAWAALALNNRQSSIANQQDI
jgi:hypothetical protein